MNESRLSNKHFVFRSGEAIITLNDLFMSYLWMILNQLSNNLFITYFIKHIINLIEQTSGSA